MKTFFALHLILGKKSSYSCPPPFQNPAYATALCYCYDITSLIEKLGKDHIASEWHLFLDSSKRNLKAVLLHNGNIKPFVPLAHSVHFRESYESIEILLNAIQYNEYN